ncbi:interleukin-12 subunit alpha [Pungitius pungitius]|uniref:interleukin-12 subunit alpha n=1 Tax=Pungitius pungitius TaxID=134920 RepID=UPI002E144660
MASCALLLTLTWRTCSGVPVSAPSAEQYGDCSLRLRDLLRNISTLLRDGVLFHGIPPTDTDTVRVRSQDETVLACAPTLTWGSSCTMQRNSSFSESECLSNIGKDLSFYAAALQSYCTLNLRTPVEVSLLSPTLEIIQWLWKTCPLMQNGENYFSKDAAQWPWKSDSFDNRVELKKIMRGFYVRTITINRAMGYIASGDHRK